MVKTPRFHHEGLVPDQETEIPQAAQQGQNKSMCWLSLRRTRGVRRGTRKLSATFYVLKNISETNTAIRVRWYFSLYFSVD